MSVAARDRPARKAENPFDALARHALRECQAGRTRSLRAFAAENAIALDDD